MGDSFLVGLRRGEDLLGALNSLFRSRGTTNAAFNVIGVVSHAILGFFDPSIRQYRTKGFSGHHEIVSCMGNVSEKDGEPFVHAHIVLAGEDFGCLGGHLMPGTVIFVSEVAVFPMSGPALARKLDEQTQLALWETV
jgi:uncharacterized protein